MNDLIEKASWAADVLDGLHKELKLNLVHGIAGLRGALLEYEKDSGSVLNIRMGNKTKKRLQEMAVGRDVAMSEMARHFIDIGMLVTDISVAQYKHVKSIMDGYKGVGDDKS